MFAECCLRSRCLEPATGSRLEPEPGVTSDSVLIQNRLLREITFKLLGLKSVFFFSPVYQPDCSDPQS